ncbi:MAG: PIG-L family deacetylase [Chloroflexi bacterium]|nr:PIG-L family deacetylase [Chloroflexota bacterium]
MVQRRLLGIFAHPDDESFGPGGTLARYAREGVEVHVCIVTDGASGSTVPDVVSPDATRSLADLRRQELACACQVLGVHLHTMGYRDSGMEGAPDNKHPASLYQADLDDVARGLVRVIRQTRPHVVITHDPTGGYFHPDHVRVNHAVRRAWRKAAGDADACPLRRAEGYAPWLPARLYYAVVARSSLRWYVWLLRLRGQDPRHYGRQGDVDLTRVGVPDRMIHVRLDVEPYVAIKQEAGACHQSQGGGSARWRALPAWLSRRAMRHEHFVQAYPEGGRQHGDLFEGFDFADE